MSMSWTYTGGSLESNSMKETYLDPSWHSLEGARTCMKFARPMANSSVLFLAKRKPAQNWIKKGKSVEFTWSTANSCLILVRYID